MTSRFLQFLLAIVVCLTLMPGAYAKGGHGNGHGGGDKVMLDELFLPDPKPDKYLRAADERAGAASCLIGIAANRCFETQQPVAIADLVYGLKSPDYSEMPTRTGPVPMPGKA